MRTNQSKPIRRLNRSIAIGFLPACLIALSLLISAGPASNLALANSEDKDGNAATYRGSTRFDVQESGNNAPYIVEGGVRMYEVPEREAGGWPVRALGDDTYGQGELIAVEVEFNEAVSVDDETTFRIQMGSYNRRALVPISRRGNTVIFGTLIQPQNSDSDGVWIGDNTTTLDHNEADAIRSVGDSPRNAHLSHASLGTQSNHKVDGSSTRPAINRVRITSSPQYADAYVRGETVRLEIAFDSSVVVRGNVSARLRIEALGSTVTRQAYYISGSGTSNLVFEYPVFLLDNDSNGIAIPADTLAKDGNIALGAQGGGSITGTSRTLRANLASRGHGNNRSHRVDARYAAIPELMAVAQWGWETRTGASESITMDFTVREDPGHFSEDYALVAALGWSSIGNTRFGFGIRTDVDDPDTDGSEGKGIVFNRWGTHDTAQARPTEDGWVVTGTILGNFISIRKPYDWGAGDYTVRIAQNGEDDDDGRWYGMWIRDKSTNVETYMGSLKFPMVNDSPPMIEPRQDLYWSMLVVLGGPAIKPYEIPVFEIALSPPNEGSSSDPPKRITTTYSQFHGAISNANITHDRNDDLVIMRAGGTTLRTTDPGTGLTIRNDEATGTPTIRGTAEMDQFLGVSTSDIADADGLDEDTFTYQWIRVDGTSETNIRNARGRYYTIGVADKGKTIKVRVSFTDDAGYDETLTSEATALIPFPPLTAEFSATPTSHDGQGAFTFKLRFSEQFDLSYITLRDHAFTVSGGSVTKASRRYRSSNIQWEIRVEPDGNGAVSIALPATTDCSAQGAICTSDGRMLSDEVNLTVPGPGG